MNPECRKKYKKLKEESIFKNTPRINIESEKEKNILLCDPNLEKYFKTKEMKSYKDLIYEHIEILRKKVIDFNKKSQKQRKKKKMMK